MELDLLWLKSQSNINAIKTNNNNNNPLIVFPKSNLGDCVVEGDGSGLAVRFQHSSFPPGDCLRIHLELHSEEGCEMDPHSP
jgi:hypothetical protein